MTRPLISMTALATAALFAASPGHADDPVLPDMAVWRIYSDCSAEATRRRLTNDEALACLDAYLRVKLSFLPGMDIERFLKLAPDARWEVNRRAYAAYVAWKAGLQPGF